MNKDNNIFKTLAFSLSFASFLFLLLFILSIWNVLTGFGEYFFQRVNHAFYFTLINPYANVELFNLSYFERYLRNLLSTLYVSLLSIIFIFTLSYLQRLIIFLIGKKYTTSFSLYEYFSKFSFKSKTLIITTIFCLILLTIELLYYLANIGGKYIELFRSIHPNPFIPDELISISIESSTFNNILAAGLDLLYTLIDSIILCLSVQYLYKTVFNLLEKIILKIRNFKKEK